MKPTTDNTEQDQKTKKGDDHSNNHNKRFFIQMSGVPGSGKSTTAKLLSQRLSGDGTGGAAVIIDHDTIRSCLLEDDDDDGNGNGNGLPFEKAAKLAYKLNWRLLEDLASQSQQGNGGIRYIINDSPCNYRQVIENGVGIAGRHGMEYRYVECTGVKLEDIDRRLKGRKNPMRSQRTGVGRAPGKGWGGGGKGKGKEEEEEEEEEEKARELFRKKFDNPCRPTGDEEGEAILVQTNNGDPEGCVGYIIERLGV